MRKLLVLSAFAFACAHHPAVLPQSPTPPAEMRYVMIMAGKPAGSQVVRVNGNDRIIDFEYNDRGRGPKTRTTVRLDASGVPVALQTTGVDYFKVPIDERFEIANGSARWDNGSEKGDGATGRYFFGMYGAPADIGMLVRAAVNSGGRIGLLPAGEATVVRGNDLTIEGTSGSARVTRYEITGLGFSPADVWLDDRGEFFGALSSWSSVVRQGFESAIPKLMEAQEIAGKARTGELAKKLTRRPAAIAITNARLFDPATLKVTPGQTVLIRGNRIEAVGTGVTIPADAERLDATNKTVIPGLWDMHVHLGDEDGLLNIAAGVTDVRDLGNDVEYVTALRRQFDSGAAIGPRALLAGLVDGPGPYAGPTKFLIDSEDDARKAIDTFAANGFVQTKIYSSIRPGARAVHRPLLARERSARERTRPGEHDRHAGGVATATTRSSTRTCCF